MAKATRKNQPAMIESNSNLDFGFKTLPLLEDGIYQGKAKRYGTMKSGRHYIVCEINGREVWRTYPGTDNGARWITSDLRAMTDSKMQGGKITPPANVWCDVGTFKNEFVERNQVNAFVSTPSLDELGETVDDDRVDA